MKKESLLMSVFLAVKFVLVYQAQKRTRNNGKIRNISTSSPLKYVSVVA